jgi:hypothetical protein
MGVFLIKDDLIDPGVVTSTGSPPSYVEGDTWFCTWGASMADRGRIALSTYKYDRTDPDNWIIQPYLDTYQLIDDGWTRVARTATPYQQFHSQGGAKTLDTSFLLATDFDSAAAPSGRYQFGYYVASYDETGVFTIGPKLNVGTLDNVWYMIPDSMVRLPGTNDFLAIRTGDPQPLVDLLRVSGDTITLLDTKSIPYSTLASEFIESDGFHLVAIDSANATTAIEYQQFDPDGAETVIQMVHLTVSADTVAIYTQEYVPNRVEMLRGGPSVYRSPLEGHQVETLYADWTDGATQDHPIVRKAYDYASGTFAITDLPADQTFLTKYKDPPNYAHRVTSGYGPSLDPLFAGYVVVGDQVYIVSEYSESASDDTWLVAWQVDGTSGAITAFSWSKGPQDGAEDDQLFFNSIFTFYDAPTSQLVVVANSKFYPGGGLEYATSNRMATYRLDYSLSAKLRSHRWAFMPTT